MARTVINIPLQDQDLDKIINMINKILYRYGYVKDNMSNETTWKKGGSFFTPMKCFSICFTENSLVLEGWVKDIIFGEVDLEGIVLAVPKRGMKNIMEEIRMCIMRC